MISRSVLALAWFVVAAVPLAAQGCSGEVQRAGGRPTVGNVRVGNVELAQWPGEAPPARSGSVRLPQVPPAASSLPAVPVPRLPAPGASAPVAPPQPTGARVLFPTVAVLLPLTGQYESFGQAALRGVRLGLGTEGGSPPPLRALVHDTKGEAAEAERAYRSYAADPNVIAVLGPMLAWEVEAVKQAAGEARLATISFSQREVPPGGPILRFSMTRGEQAAVLAEYAVAERGLGRFAILYPDDSYGNELADAFRTEVANRGGQVVASVSYETSKVDFQEDVGRLRARLGVPEKPPADYQAPVDAVFIPDSADRVAIIAPFLAYLDIRGVQLLGANGWNQPEALGRGSPQVDGAIFVDGFYPYGSHAETRAFVNAYRDAHGSDPGILEAFGYDAARLLRDLFLAGAGDRASQLASLSAPRVVRGATGVARFSGSGRIDRSLFVLSFADRVVREVERSSDAPVTPAGTGGPLGAPGAAIVAPAGGRSHSLPTPYPGVRWIRPEYDSRSDSPPASR